MAAPRVTRRNALVAAAGWVAAPRVSVTPSVVPAAAGAGESIHVLYPAIARALLRPHGERRAVLERALGAEHPAHAAYGPGLVDYLLEQSSGLGPAEAIWAARAAEAEVAGQARLGLRRARALLASEHDPPVFLIYSRRFDGRSDGRAIYLGIDRFGGDRLQRGVALLTAHEYNHVVRAAHAPFTTVLDAVVAEGLATACSELAEPGRALHEYLLYPPEQCGWYTLARLRDLWAALARDSDAATPGCRSRYLTSAEDGPVGAPPRTGYYLGYLIVRAWLRRGAALATLTRMPSAEIWSGSGYAP